MNEQSAEILQSFNCLGLPTHSSPEEIRAAYRRLSLQNHPDVAIHSSAESDQKELNAAYDVAIAFAENCGGALVLQKKEIATLIRTAVSHELAPVEARRKVEQIKRQDLQSVRSIRSNSWILGAMGAGLCLIADRLPDLMAVAGIEQGADKRISAIFGLIAIACAVTGFIFQMILDRCERGIDEYSDELDDRRFCASELARHLSYADDERFTEDVLTKAYLSARWPIPPISFLSHRVNLTSLLLIKAIDHGLIERYQPAVVAPDKPDEYVIKFRPSDFAPVPPPPPYPPEPMSTSDAIRATAAGAVLAISLCVLMLYLLIFVKTWWAIAPGFFALTFGMMSAMGIGDIKQARLRERDLQEQNRQTGDGGVRP